MSTLLKINIRVGRLIVFIFTIISCYVLLSLFVRSENYFYPFLARPPLFTKSVAIFWFRSFALNEQQASFFSGRQVVAATWCPPLSNKLAEIFDFSASLR